MPNKRSIWLITLGAVILSGAALVTLRAAEQASAQPVPTNAAPPGSPPTPPPHPAPSAPEESATIADDPTTAPDPSQSADNNVSFPTDI
jgi:hypothetical protein